MRKADERHEVKAEWVNKLSIFVYILIVVKLSVYYDYLHIQYMPKFQKIFLWLIPKLLKSLYGNENTQNNQCMFRIRIKVKKPTLTSFKA